MRDSEKSHIVHMDPTESYEMEDEERMSRRYSGDTPLQRARIYRRILLSAMVFVFAASVCVRAQQGMQERAGQGRYRRGKPEARAGQPMKWQDQVGVFLSLSQERARLTQRKDQLLNRLVDAKKRFEQERRPLRRFLLRREIDQAEADLHQTIGESMAKQQEQRQLLRQFVNNREEIEEAITRRSEEIERQTEALKQAPDANRQQMLRLQREQTRLSRMKELLAMMETDPERLIESPPTELPEPLVSRPGSPHGPMAVRLQGRLERLERQLLFLQKRIDDCQKEIHEIRDSLAPYLPGEKTPTESPSPSPPQEPTATAP